MPEIQTDYRGIDENPIMENHLSTGKPAFPDQQ